MIELTGSTGKIVSALRGRHDTLPLPENKCKLLREPIIYKASVEELEDSYIEDLIQKNIINTNNGSHHDIIRSAIVAVETRALFNSLSEAHKKKFISIIKAFDIALNKDQNRETNKKMIEGALIAGGEIRVVASSGIVMVINALTNILGLNLKNIYGVSAGGFEAAGLAVNARNSRLFSNTADTDFASFYRKRHLLEEWINRFMKEGYCFNTGKQMDSIDYIRAEHIQELGHNLQLAVGEVVRRFPPKIETYFLPQELSSRYNRDPISFELATAAAASANLIGLFFSPFDMTFGDCHVKDSKGKKHFLIDSGITREKMVPIQPLETGIREYLSNKIEYPPFYFIVGNRRVDKEELASTDQNGQYLGHGFMHWVVNKVSEFIDNHSKDPVEKIYNLGAQRAYCEASCLTEDPYKPGEIAALPTGNLSIPCDKREVLISANIPTMDFKDLKFKAAIDQLYENFVDSEYVSSDGERGKSPLQLYIDDINKASGKQIQHEPSKAAWMARAAVL